MSHLIDISDGSIKKLHISENNIFINLKNENFQTIKANQITNIYRNEKFFNKYNKKPTLKQLEKRIYNYFFEMYFLDKDFYNIKVIDDIINNFDTHLVAEFKDYLIMGDDSEFLQRKYNMEECKKYLPTLFDYYKSCSVIFPNYVVLPESKYIFKNIRKKQKVIDNQQEQDEKQEKIKKGEINLDENDDFFTSNAFNSILNQTNTSNLRLFFGINSKGVKDSVETMNNIFKKIIKAENDAIINKKNYIFKKNFKKIINPQNEIISKINIYKINNIISKANNGKIKKGINNNNHYLNKKYSYINKILETNKNKENHNNKINESNNKINNHINIIYSNKNKMEKSKNIYKLNTSRKHIKSNAFIFETDINRNNSSNRNMNKKKSSKKKLKNTQGKKKKEIIMNKELINKIIQKIKTSKSAIFKGCNSFHILKKKKSLINRKENLTTNSLSISPTVNSNLCTKKINKVRGNINIKISESNSTPSVVKIKNYKNNKKEVVKNKPLNTKRENKDEYKMIKVNSNLNIEPLKEIYIKKDFYNHTHSNANSNINIKNNGANNYIKKKVYKSNNNIKFKNENNDSKKKIKKNEANKNKKFNLNIYKVSQNSLAQKYITNNTNKNYDHIQTSSNITISREKQLNENKFGSIKVIKKQETIDFAKKSRTDIKNNININININNNNIYNNSNQINYNNKIINNNNTSNNIQNNNISVNNNLNKKKYKEISTHSSLNTQRNESQPILKKIILTSSSNRNIYNSKKNFIFEEMNKKKISCLNSNNTLTFSGFLTSRNTHNVSKIKNKIKNTVGNVVKQKNINNNNKFKKELLAKKEGTIINKNKAPLLKNIKQNSNNNVLKK